MKTLANPEITCSYTAPPTGFASVASAVTVTLLEGGYHNSAYRTGAHSTKGCASPAINCPITVTANRLWLIWVAENRIQLPTRVRKLATIIAPFGP